MGQTVFFFFFISGININIFFLTRQMAHLYALLTKFNSELLSFLLRMCGESFKERK